MQKQKAKKDFTRKRNFIYPCSSNIPSNVARALSRVASMIIEKWCSHIYGSVITSHSRKFYPNRKHHLSSIISLFCRKFILRNETSTAYISETRRFPVVKSGQVCFSNLNLEHIKKSKQSEKVTLASRNTLNCAQAEREFYRESCSCVATMFNRLEVEINLNEMREPCSFNGMMHNSFEDAQQVHFPSNPMQLGPIYFKTLRKCGIFGIMCEAVPRQVNYLNDEAVTVGKGTNATIIRSPLLCRAWSWGYRSSPTR